MKKELELELFALGPWIYRDRFLSMKETCMCWGICCPDEWFEPLRELTIALETYLKKENEGFRQAFRVEQVKEKFYHLAYYIPWELETPEVKYYLSIAAHGCEAASHLEEFNKLKEKFLMDHPRVLSKMQLLAASWGNVSRLRYEAVSSLQDISLDEQSCVNAQNQAAIYYAGVRDLLGIK